MLLVCPLHYPYSWSSPHFSRYFIVIIVLLSSPYHHHHDYIYWEFFTSPLGWWSSLESKWLQLMFPWTLLSILADLNNAVVWKFLIYPSISYFSNPLTKFGNRFHAQKLLWWNFTSLHNSLWITLFTQLCLLFERFRQSVSWNILNSCFLFTFLFPNYCCSIYLNVVSVVSGRCNQTYFALFGCSFSFVILMHPHSHQCWRVLFFHLFFIHIVCLCRLSHVRPCASSSAFLSSDPFVKILYYYYYYCEFFTQNLLVGPSMGVEWPQVSSNRLDSSQNSARFQKYCCLDNLDS